MRLDNRWVLKAILSLEVFRQRKPSKAELEITLKVFNNEHKAASQHCHQTVGKQIQSRPTNFLRLVS